jgi:hypothetical protein
MKKKTIEICIRCGQSVARGTECFEDRMFDPNTFEVRIDHGCLYPHGDYVCIECQQICPITELNHSRHAGVIRRLRRGINNLYPRRLRGRG